MKLFTHREMIGLMVMFTSFATATVGVYNIVNQSTLAIGFALIIWGCLDRKFRPER